ncbi:hypothetical protein CDD83_968 [Cordyceps sp. RAO-2017]|nr:hypothetical protein CDD83_968 [Cordyceps sp. RAO-2017]
MDPEQRPAAGEHLQNTTVGSVAWRGVTVTVRDRDRDAKQIKTIVDNVDGIVEAGECCALMGPSGSGKTTLLNALARRPTGGASVSQAEILVNGSNLPLSEFRQVTSFVEERDALIGSLTVFETLAFASKLSTTRDKHERLLRINALLDAFGLSDRANVLIGTPARKGISDGQKRRVSIASQLITEPKILFLDEPTSGLDSVASFEVVRYLRQLAKRHNLIVICSIHQPSSSTFNLFDKLLLLSEGKTHYFGAVGDVAEYYEEMGVSIPRRVNTAEFLLELVNADFAEDKALARRRLAELQEAWSGSRHAKETHAAALGAKKLDGGASPVGSESESAAAKKPGAWARTVTLLHRGVIKSYRDVLAYGIRLAMYVGLALMMGTVWLRLRPEQESIQPLINGIFFGSAFMSFMAVAYVPAFLEDYQTFVKERRNGLCGPLELVLSNLLVGAPCLFAIAAVFSAITYWLSAFRPGADAFLTWLMWLFLDLLAAESLVVLVASLLPNFVVALAVVAFANGLWMSVGGFMVPPALLNAFYRYAFHPWDYQRYVFEGMMVNEFARRSYDCGPACRCMYDSALADRCSIDGRAVLDRYGYQPGSTGRHVGILVAIVAGYRLAAWLVLRWKSS